MSARMTVVFDDESLYKRTKVFAAEHDRPVKQVIEEALRAYLGPSEDEGWMDPDWDAFDAWQADLRAEARSRPGGGPTDLSNVKQYLYGAPREREPMLADETAEYDANR
ncbi:MAG TPA: hypothetical protein VFK32_02205 [Tepidiformaceae bacterium]|nr:hypothetical protein [Tepidiformaceae bacterium]